jgi:hypothetical protein
MAKEDDLTKLLSMTDIINEDRLKDRYSGKKATQPSMTKLMQPEEMKNALAQSDDAGRLAKDIEGRIAKKSANKAESQAMRDFIEKYGSKMQAPKGMKIGSIADETARLGMKLPQAAKGLGKAGKIGGGLALGLAGELLLPEELGDPRSIIENPDASPEERKAAMEAMMAESRPQMEEQMRKQALDEMMEKLRQEKLQRAEMLMKKYGKR